MVRGLSDEPIGGIEVVELPETTLTRLWGEIDEALREDASDALSRALTRALPVVVDAAGVTFIDSAGVAFLVQFCRIGREEGMPVTLRHPSPAVRDVIGLLGLDELFDSVEQDADAVS